MVGSVEDGILADEGIHGAVVLAKETTSEDLIIDVATADVDAVDHIFTCCRRETQGIVGLAGTAIHIGIDVSTHDIDGVGTCNKHGVS